MYTFLSKKNIRFQKLKTHFLFFWRKPFFWGKVFPSMAKRLKWWHPLRSSGSPSPTTSQSPHLYIHVPLLQTKFKNCEAHIKIGRPSAFADISIQELLASAHMSSTVTYIHVRAHTCMHKTLPCPSCQCWWMATTHG